MSEIMDYDPNLTCSGNMAKQTVRLTFAMWKYRAYMDVVVGGNCTGLTVIDCAVDNAYRLLEQKGIYASDDTIATITMLATDESGDTLECDDDEGHCEDWLKDMLIAAEIIAIKPDSQKRL